MIKTLHITNYALISDLEVDFADGFNIITGETGAGKSIMLGALSLLLGERADSRAVRDASRKSVIEATFDISGNSEVAAILRSNELDDADSTECILRREIAPGGRSRAFVNDTPVTLPVLRDIAVHLVDIHSQHQNLLLSQAEYQLGVIDNIAGTQSLLTEYRQAYAAYREALKQYTDTREMIRRNRDDADFIRYQYQQLAELAIEPGEQAQLEQERERLSNATDIKERLSHAIDPLNNDAGNALETLHSAIGALQELTGTDGADGIDFAALADRLESARIEIADVTETLEAFDTTLMADPSRLDEVEERLAKFYSLEVKHHADDSDALIALADRLQQQLDALEDADGVLLALETAAKRAKRTAVTLATEISDLRTAAAGRFAEELRATAAPLGMSNLRCEISVSRTKLGPAGFDQIQFLFAFNKNQSLMPVKSVASGGEISRLMLAIKTMLAQKMNLPSIIFDEVDTGVSGDIATRMAAMMSSISRRIQVITITHLPGVAAAGHTHFKVYKEDDDTSTHTYIRLLDEAERQAELALMISGNADDEAALANARALLNHD